jgi:glycosidase
MNQVRSETRLIILQVIKKLIKLDYIQRMGFTAIWITPITGQLPQDTGDGEAYHGYWQQDM